VQSWQRNARSHANLEGEAERILAEDEINGLLSHALRQKSPLWIDT
jgi:hypothetical protein